jgi:hypothetical protein
VEHLVFVLLLGAAVLFALRKMRTPQFVVADPLDFTELPVVAGRYTLHLSGEQYDGRQGSIGRLEPGQRLVLRREPGNPHDSNAIAVTTQFGSTIGYIPRKNANWVARLLDEGYSLSASVACLFDDDRDGDVDVQIHIDNVPDIRSTERKRRRRARQR